MFKNLNLKERILTLIFLTSSIVFPNPRNPITVSTVIDVEVVKPIEVISKSYIQHNVFKGTTKDVNGDIFLELRASSNQTLNISYPSDIPLIRDSNVIRIILKGIKEGVTTETGGTITNLIDSPKYGASKNYYIPYAIAGIAGVKGGVYEGVVPITISYN